jgi:hypothetical protein
MEAGSSSSGTKYDTIYDAANTRMRKRAIVVGPRTPVH